MVFLCQKKYATVVLNRFRIENYNSVCDPIVPKLKICKDENGAKVDVNLYKQIVGSLVYLTATHLMFVVSLISRFTACSTQQHAKRVLRYCRL